LLGGSLNPGDKVIVDAGGESGRLTFEVVEGAVAVASEAE
jgi:hypothetical protein